MRSVIVLLLVNPILIANSSSSLSLNSEAYTPCFELKAYSDSVLSGEAAMNIASCFLGSAESLLPYFNENDLSSSPNRSNIITALEYADSWFRLAITNGRPEAELGLRQAGLYIIKLSGSSSSEL
jgi:hypothetical protein